MCIIAIKPKNKAMFNSTMLENMVKNNPDGSGFMYLKDSQVHIQKGFMTLKALKKALKSVPASSPCILHCRIATHGKVNAGTTHPFPISESIPALQQLITDTDIGMVHNGIIPIETPESISDTMQYISKVLYPMYVLDKSFYMQELFQQIMLWTADSKLCFLDKAGNIVTIGNFIQEDEYTFSNSSYLPKVMKAKAETAYYSTTTQCTGYQHEQIMIVDSGTGIWIEDNLLSGTYGVDRYGILYSIQHDQKGRYAIELPDYWDSDCYFEYDPTRAETIPVSYY